MPKVKREQYRKRKDGLIVFSQLPEDHVFYAMMSGRVEKFRRRGSSGLHVEPAKDKEGVAGLFKGLVPFSATEYVGLNIPAARSK